MRGFSIANVVREEVTSCAAPPSDIRLSDIIRLIDGPLAPFGDADQLRTLIARDKSHRALYRVFLDVRDATANILENTTIADIVRSKKVQARH
jgi:DNA-binding IscR family transcriptional regulator